MMINRRVLRSAMAPARWGKAASMLFRVAFLLMVGYVFVYPFLHMVITAIKSYDDLHDVSVMWIPRSPTLQNFSIANGYLDYWKHFGISAFLALFTIGAKISFCAFIAYGFARYDFAGKKLLFFIVILSMIIPVQTLLLPQYIMFSQYKWIGTYLPLTIPQIFGFGLKGGVFIFLFRQYFLQTPKALEEAARIDGCGKLRTYLSISLPCAKPAIIISIVIALVWSWNEYYEPMLYLRNVDMRPLPAMLDKVYTTYQNYLNPSLDFDLTASLRTMDPNAIREQMVTEGTLMAATFMCILPVLLAYAFLQKYFVESVARSGLVE